MSERRDQNIIDSHRLTEFIYGTVTALVAVAGINTTETVTWYSAMLTIITGGAAIWLAHAYSSLMSHRITSGAHIQGKQIGEALSSSWPIVSAALLVSLPFLGAAVSLYTMSTALNLANGAGVLILALIGFAAGVITDETWMRRIALVLLSSSLGLLIVAIELAVHH